MAATHQKSEAILRGARMLRTALGPAIARFLEDPAIVEVMLNPDGRLWIDQLSEGLSDTGELLSPSDGERIIRLVAHHVGAEVHPGAPRVSAELPETGERFEGLLPPVVSAPAFAIRKPAVAVFTLDDYVAAGIMVAGQAETLRQAVADRRNILVAGGTSTGKTTLTNALLAEISKTSDRVVLIEDTRELQCAAPNLVPFAIAGGLGLLYIFRGRVEAVIKARIDIVGLGLLVVWVGALQIMLDEGRNHDWFAAAEIRLLAAVAAVGFVAFLIWELTEKHPIVNLRVFRHRGFVAASITYCVAFGTFFATVVIIPLWLQSNMGYTATWAGYATGIMGVLAIIASPIIGKAVETIDARLIVSIGVLGLGLVSVWRMGFTPDMAFIQMAGPMLLTGVFLMMFIIPVTGLCMASVDPDEQEDSAGISNFMRVLGGAFATSLVQTGWTNAARHNQAELTGAMTQGQATLDGMMASGAPPEAARTLLAGLLEGQSYMLATLNVFAAIAICFAFAATLIWFVPKPKGPINTSGGH